MFPSSSSLEYAPKWWRLFAILLTACIALTLVLVVGQIPLKLIAAGILGGCVFGLALASGQVKSVLLAAWVMALTYNRMYFIFEPLVGYQAGQGPYVVVSDVFLLALLVHWAISLIARKALPRPRGRPVWPWLAPFLVVAVIGVLHSRRPAWGFFELWRYLKLGLILLYFRYQVDKRAWWACIAAFGLAVFFQGTLSVTEIASGKSGVLGVLGFGTPQDVPEALRDEVFLGWHRATATMSHPPQLACYFILINPVLFALAFGTRIRRLRRVALIAALIGWAGLGCTLSRWPNTLMVMELVLLLSGLVAMRLCAATHALAFMLIGVLGAGVVIFSFRDFLLDRLVRDLSRSIEFRKTDDTTGLRVAQDHPWFGVGLNNYHDYLLEYEPSWQWALQYENLSIHKQHTRPIASPHSAYLLYLAETGVTGLLAWFWVLASILRGGWRAMRLTKGPWKAVCYGLMIGLVAHYLQQLVDFSMVFDPLLYTLALVGGLLNVAPDLFRTARTAASVAPMEVAA